MGHITGKLGSVLKCRQLDIMGEAAQARVNSTATHPWSGRLASRGAGCSKEFHPSCALAGTYAFVDLKDDAHFRFYCEQHGSPCLYCICRKQFGEGEADMVECSRCKV